MEDFTKYVENVDRDVTFSQPTGLDLIRFISRAPPMEDDEAPGAGAREEFMILAIEFTTDLSDEEIEGLQLDGVETVMACSTRAINGDGPPSSSTDYKVESKSPFDGFDLNDDGTLNPDDWR